MWRAASAGSSEVLWVSESSPDSAEPSFRELDDVFLQTRTRLWLGEVLHVRFDEDVAIADLLADGELLFQVSKEVWKMLLKKHGELKHSKLHIYERTSSGKSDGRYMPYPKVDSFLKICQILGLTGIDLFSPSDAVEKRDIRRVCMCIRSLSKKARSKKLNVPDFDVVTYTVSMPTHLVGVIRRSLELSLCSPSSSNGSPWNDAMEICGPKFPFGQHYQQSDSGSDEVESIFIDLEFESPLSSASYDASNINYIVGETSPGLDSVDETVLECSSFSSMCSTCNDENIEDGSNLVANNSMQENDVSKSNFKMDLNEAMINTLAPDIEEDADVAAHCLSLEERKFDKNAIFSRFEDHFMSSNFNGDTSHQTIDNLPSSTPDCREGLEVTSDGSIKVEKQVMSNIYDACAEPNNAPQAILDNTIYQEETIKPDECEQNKERGRIVGKPGNQVLISVAGVITMVGALVLFLHARQKKDKEKNNETGVLFQIQQPNQEFFTKRQTRTGKSDSLYPGEKLKF